MWKQRILSIKKHFYKKNKRKRVKENASVIFLLLDKKITQINLIIKNLLNIFWIRINQIEMKIVMLINRRNVKILKKMNVIAEEEGNATASYFEKIINIIKKNY